MISRRDRKPSGGGQHIIWQILRNFVKKIVHKTKRILGYRGIPMRLVVFPDLSQSSCVPVKL